MSLSSFMFVKACTKSDAKRDAGLEIPESVEYVRDIRYGRNKKYHTLDICFPASSSSSSKSVNDSKTYDDSSETNEETDSKDSKKPSDSKIFGIFTKPKKKLPVIISIHGGGYVYGTKEVYQFYCASLAERGFAVINFNYRLAPKYKFPAPLEDLNLVIKWMISNADEYNLDMDNVFLVGDSAGAQLASQYGVIYSSKEYRSIMDFKKPRIKIRAIGLCCGTYDLKKNLLDKKKRGALLDYLTTKPEKFGNKLDILEYINEDFPPAYLFSAKGDFLMEDCEPMAKLLKSRGVECKYKIYGNRNTYHVFHVDMRNEFGKEANDDQMDFFKRHIR